MAVVLEIRRRDTLPVVVAPRHSAPGAATRPPVNLLLLEPSELTDAGTVALTGDRARHLLAVLKVTLGQTVRAGVVDGPFGACTVTAVDTGRVELAFVAGPTPPVPRVDLLMALPRPKVLRRLWAQLAALGVGRVMLANAERVERNYFDTHLLDADVYRPLLIEGLQQARDTRVPVVTVHRRFRVLVEDELDGLTDAGIRLLADPSGAETIAKATGNAGAGDRVLLAIGPEGGWNTFELDLLGARGFQTVSMGPRTLRSDTATVALLALVHAVLDGA